MRTQTRSRLCLWGGRGRHGSRCRLRTRHSCRLRRPPKRTRVWCFCRKRCAQRCVGRGGRRCELLCCRLRGRRERWGLRRRRRRAFRRRGRAQGLRQCLATSRARRYCLHRFLGTTDLKISKFGSKCRLSCTCLLEPQWDSK